VTSSVTWPFDYQAAIYYYRCFIGTKSVSVAVVEIMISKYIGVMTLTSHGHVTSSATWPFESQSAISYRRSIVTNSLSPAVLEILGPQHMGITTELAAGQLSRFLHKGSVASKFAGSKPSGISRVGAMLEAYRTNKQSPARASGYLWQPDTWTDRQCCEKTSQSD